MHHTEYVVTQREGAWTIRFSGRYFDRFETEDEALERAMEWAVNARRQGHRVPVLLERNTGEVQIVQAQTPNANAAA